MIGAASARLKEGATRIFAGEDVCFPIGKVPYALRTIKEIGRQNNIPVVIYGHIGDGNMHTAPIIDPLKPEEVAAAHAVAHAIHKLALEVGGSTTGEHGVGFTRVPYMKADAVVTDCASCSSTLSESYVKLFEPETAEYQQAKELSQKVMDINKFLMEKTGVRTGDRPLQAKVTYHDPCHLKRAQKVFKQPRELLQSIPGVEFKEMKEADRCCGSAGSFSIMHHELSMKILEHKIENIRNTQADIVATSCPTCTMQLSYGIQQKGIQAQVLHPVQLLAQTYGDDN